MVILSLLWFQFTHIFLRLLTDIPKTQRILYSNELFLCYAKYILSNTKLIERDDQSCQHSSEFRSTIKKAKSSELFELVSGKEADGGSEGRREAEQDFGSIHSEYMQTLTKGLYYQDSPSSSPGAHQMPRRRATQRRVSVPQDFEESPFRPLFKPVPTPCEQPCTGCNSRYPDGAKPSAAAPPEDSTALKKERKEFRNFLSENKFYSIDQALRLLLDYRLVFGTELFIAAHSRGMVRQCLGAMVERKIEQLTSSQLRFLVGKGYIEEIKTTPSIFTALPASVQVRLILSDINTVSKSLRYLSAILPYLDRTSLDEVVAFLDPLGPQMTLMRRNQSQELLLEYSSGASSLPRDAARAAGTPNIPVKRSEYLDVCLCAMIYRDALCERPCDPDKKDGEDSAVKTPRALPHGALGTSVGLGTAGRGAVDDETSSDSSDGETERLLLTTAQITAEPFAQRPRVTHIACGERHLLALTDSGFVYGLGSNAEGQLCGAAEYVTTPTILESLSQMPISGVFCGADFSFALTRGGVVWAWGDNEYGQLGLGQLCKKVAAPQVVAALRHTSVTQIAAGHAHTLFVIDRGTVFSCGLNANGQLGREVEPTGGVVQSNSTLSLHAVARSNSNGSGDMGVAATAVTPPPAPVAMTAEHAQHRSGDGKALCSCIPAPVVSDRRFGSACAGHSHSAAITEDGALYTWGQGASGQLGHGTRADQRVPRVVASLQGKRVTSVACGSYHTIAVTEMMSVYTWGSGSCSQLGAGTCSDALTPQLVPHLINRGVTGVSGGLWHSAAVADNGGQVLTWGDGSNGGLGQGEGVILSQEPAAVHSLPRGVKAKELCCGSFFTAVATEDGRLHLCGRVDDVKEADACTFQTLELPPHEAPQEEAESAVAPKEEEGKRKAEQAPPTLLSLLESHYGEFDTATVLEAAVAAQQYKAVEKILEISSDYVGAFSMRLFNIKQLFKRGKGDVALTGDQLLLSASPMLETSSKTLPPLALNSPMLSPAMSTSASGGATSPQPLLEAQSLAESEAKLCIASMDEILVKTPAEQRHNILLMGMKYWKERCFPVGLMEGYIEGHLDLIAQPLSVLLAASEEDVLHATGEKPLLVQASYSLEESRQLHDPAEPPGKDIIPIPISHATRMAAVIAALEMQNEEASAAKSKKDLWENIMGNIGKTSGIRDKITTTPYCSSAQPTAQPHTVFAKDTVVFTCGHYLTRKELGASLQQIRDCLTSAPMSASLITQAYKSEGFIPLACPSCVLTTFIKPTIDKICVKSSKSKQEKERSTSGFDLRATCIGAMQHNNTPFGVAMSPSIIKKKKNETGMRTTISGFPRKK